MTERARVEAVRWLDEWVSYLLAVTSDAVLILDQSGRIEAANVAAGRILGKRVADLVGAAAEETLQADLSAELLRAVSGETVEAVLMQLERGGGPPVPVQLSARECGSKRVIVFQDRTEEVESQIALRRAQDQLASTQTLGQMGLWHWSVLTDELQLSAQLYEILGIMPQAFGGTAREVLPLVHEDHLDAVANAVAMAKESGEEVEIEFVVVRPTGEHRWLHMRGSPVTDPRGSVVALSGITQDITPSRRTLQELEIANEKLARFGRVVVHDLRGPLISISGFVTLLHKREQLSGAGVALLERLAAVASEAHEVLDAISRQTLDADTHMRSEPVALREIVEWALKTLRPQIEAESPQLLVDDLPVVDGDGPRLRQALLNLLGNALKYGRKGGDRPIVRVWASTAADVVSLHVDDNGPGIPEAERHAVLGDGYRLDRDVVAGINGTGTGLATVVEIAREHGHELQVGESDMGGARFVLKLRRSADSSNRTALESAANEGEVA